MHMIDTVIGCLDYPLFVAGWVEESFTNFDKGINWRSYVVCDVGYPNVNNWLWTPFIERGEANRIYIEVNLFFFFKRDFLFTSNLYVEDCVSWID